MTAIYTFRAAQGVVADGREWPGEQTIDLTCWEPHLVTVDADGHARLKRARHDTNPTAGPFGSTLASLNVPPSIDDLL